MITQLTSQPIILSPEAQRRLLTDAVLAYDEVPTLNNLARIYNTYKNLQNSPMYKGVIDRRDSEPAEETLQQIDCEGESGHIVVIEEVDPSQKKSPEHNPVIKVAQDCYQSFLTNLDLAIGMISGANQKKLAVTAEDLKRMEPTTLEKIGDYLKAAVNFLIKCLTLGFKEEALSREEHKQKTDDYEQLNNYMKYAGRELKKTVTQGKNLN